MQDAASQHYVAAAVAAVPRCVFQNGIIDKEAVDHNLSRCIASVHRAAEVHGARLIVFPQFGITGHAMVSADAWCEVAFELTGRGLERIAEAARYTGAFITVQVPERHPAFPGRYFLSCVVIGPDNGVVLVHRKGYSLSLRTSPVDVYHRYLEVFGPDAFHPVVDTPIGRLGATIGAELHWPEACRALALKGAEVIVNPINAVPALDYLHRAGAQHVRCVRAFENMVYLATANIAAGSDAPPSTFYDFKGTQIGATAMPDEDITTATIDLAELRSWRGQASANFLAQIQAQTNVLPNPALHWPTDRWPTVAPTRFEQLAEVEAATWQNLRDSWGR